MAITPFSDKQKEFTDRIHKEWRDVIYPPCFGVGKEAVRYWDDMPPDKAKYLDSWFGIDRILRYQVDGWEGSFLVTSQERFRDAEYQSCQDLTITRWNNISGLRGELFKLAAMLFVYGYYSPAEQRLVEVIVVDSPNMVSSIAQGQLQPYGNRNPRSQQPFVACKFDDLKRLGLVRLHLKEINGVLLPQATEIGGIA